MDKCSFCGGGPEEGNSAAEFQKYGRNRLAEGKLPLCAEMCATKAPLACNGNVVANIYRERVVARDVPVSVWSLSCFYVRKGCRRRGVTSALIAAALKAAKRAKAPALEAYPFDADMSPSASGSGYASTFARAGFKAAARRAPPRPIMRHDLKAIAR